MGTRKIERTSPVARVKSALLCFFLDMKLISFAFSILCFIVLNIIFLFMLQYSEFKQLKKQRSDIEKMH